MKLSGPLMIALHEGRITPAEAFSTQAKVDADAPAKRKCSHRKVEKVYREIEDRIDEFPNLKPYFDLHRETVESKPHLSPCFVTRKRCDLIHKARLAGMKLPFDLNCLPEASRMIRLTCPETDHAYVIGKGPSIDALTYEDFDDPDAPVLCINESVKTIEKLGLPNAIFTVVQDSRVVNRSVSRHSYRLLSYYAWSGARVGEQHDVTVYFPEEIGGRRKSITANQCCRLLGHAGFKTATFYGFDACLTGDVGYADSVGADPLQWDKKKFRFRHFCKEIKAEATVRGISYDFRMPRKTWTVVCVMKSGGEYADYHVDWLREQVEKHVKTPHRFVCLNDVNYSYGLPLEENWPGWWSKIEMFGERLNGLNFYLDLDTVINRDIILPDDLEDGFIYGQEDQIRKGQLYGACLMWKGDSCGDAYRKMKAEPQAVMKKYRRCGDQHLITDVMAGKVKQLSLDVRSYKNRRDHRDGDIILFHGKPRPWNIDLDYVPSLSFDRFEQYLHHVIHRYGYHDLLYLGKSNFQYLRQGCKGLHIHCPVTGGEIPENVQLAVVGSFADFLLASKITSDRIICTPVVDSDSVRAYCTDNGFSVSEGPLATLTARKHG